MTSKILFKDVIIALKQHAFVSNSYPLILSFEMHCSLKGQKRIADIIKEELAGMIFAVPENHEGHHYYPSPYSLMNKFIIKCRGKLTLKENVFCDEFAEKMKITHISNLNRLSFKVGNESTKSMKETRFSMSQDFGRLDTNANFETDIGGDNSVVIRKIPIFLRNIPTVGRNQIVFRSGGSSPMRRNEAIDSGSDSDEESDEEVDPKKKKEKKKILPELNVFYGLIGRKINLKSFASVWEIASLNEKRIEIFYRNNLKEMVDYHRRYLTRIYPKGTRVDSSNYNPMIGWATGSQIVALNFQSVDENMLLNYAKFRANGGFSTGYVLKPSYMLHDFGGKSHPYFTPGPKKPTKKVTIKIISGQALGSLSQKSKSGLSVDVKVKGLGDEKFNAVHKTHNYNGNAFHPVWASKDKPCEYSFDIASPDFCTFVFAVYSEDLLSKNRIAWYAIEMKNMQVGYRVIPLLDTDFRTVKHSYIFCHVGINDIKE